MRNTSILIFSNRFTDNLYYILMLYILILIIYSLYMHQFVQTNATRATNETCATRFHLLRSFPCKSLILLEGKQQRSVRRIKKKIAIDIKLIYEEQMLPNIALETQSKETMKCLQKTLITFFGNGKLLLPKTIA